MSCWGYGSNGQLGNGGTSDKTTPTLTSSLGTGRTAVALSSGSYHTCAILDNGAVSCWGSGTYGRLGNGGTSDKTTPTLTSSLGTGRTAVALSSGNSTPAPSLTTVLCRAGDTDPTANWVMVQRLTNQHPRSPAASVQVAQQ